MQSPLAIPANSGNYSSSYGFRTEVREDLLKSARISSMATITMNVLTSGGAAKTLSLVCGYLLVLFSSTMGGINEGYFAESLSEWQSILMEEKWTM